MVLILSGGVPALSAMAMERARGTRWANNKQTIVGRRLLSRPVSDESECPYKTLSFQDRGCMCAATAHTQRRILDHDYQRVWTLGRQNILKSLVMAKSAKNRITVLTAYGIPCASITEWPRSCQQSFVIPALTYSMMFWQRRGTGGARSGVAGARLAAA